MEKDSALYQLMGIHINGITNGDRKYQTILRRSVTYSSRLERIGLLMDIRQLIDQYVSEQNALSSWHGMLAYLLSISNCKTIFLEKCLPTGIKP